MKAVPETWSSKANFNELFEVRWRVSTLDFSCEAFTATMQSLVLYPERTSTIILRAEILEEAGTSQTVISTLFSSMSSSWEAKKLVKRRLLPRNPRIDQSMLQNCFFFSPKNGDEPAHEEHALIIYEPQDKLCIPFYHPQVSALAFHYTPEFFEISIVPLPEHIDVNGRFNIPNRVDRTLLFLMSTIVKHSMGYMSNYEKRVQHDLVVPKSAWQDLYTHMKGLYASEYLARWVECTDPKKHVFEDLGIASFLINLWQQRGLTDNKIIQFVDVGCGNGLLVDILNRQGWKGYGFDARHRKSWSIYDDNTQLLLREQILFPSILDRHYIASGDEEDLPTADSGSVLSADETLKLPEALHPGLFDVNEFLIGNHADELTPFIPMLAALASASKDLSDTRTTTEWIETAGFMIIPCCTHTFSGAKHNGLSTVGGRYASYITWLINICENLGWEVEKEALRIPSTRNWAIIGRRRRLVENDRSGSEMWPEISLNSPNRELSSPYMRLLQICHEILEQNGGMQGFLEHSKRLSTSKPRGH